MSCKYLIRAIIALAGLGIACGQKPPASPQSSANTSTGAARGATSTSGGTRKEYITDPTLNNMNAFDVTIPAKWHFQGVLYQGGNCASTPFGVFRATSPDGLSVVERLPALGWVWGTGPMIGFMPKNDCLPLKGPMSAQEFLKYLAATMKLEYVADEPVPAEENAKVQKELQDADAAYAGSYKAMNTQPPKNTVELARAIVRSTNGTFAMKGELRATVNCTETMSPGMKSLSAWAPGHPSQIVTGPPSTVDKCTVGVRYSSAPEAQYAELMRQWDAPGMGGHPEDAWQNAWIQRNTAQMQQMTNQMNQAAAQQRQAQQQQFNHDQAVRQQMHEQFLATMQRGTDMSMARTQANMNARSTAASDWVDYALDQQTVRDPNTGQVSKVSSAYSYTWVDSSGKNSYQTMSPNADPNGVLTGNWTRQQQVHGDGTGK